MVRKVAIQMDDFSKINLKSDSTIRLGWGVIRKSHELYCYTPAQIGLYDGVVKAHLNLLQLSPGNENYFRIQPLGLVNLDEMDVILVRHDPPFDNDYIVSTYFLEKIKDNTLIVNDPTSIRDYPEKIFITKFQSLCPKTLFSSNKEDILSFINEHNKVVLKPIFSCAGSDVFFVTKDDCNFDCIYDYLTNKGNRLIIAQQFLPEITNGDKRILLANGKFMGACLRRPQPNQFRANLAVGAVGISTSLTSREIEICNLLGPELRKNGIIFAGLDVIGDFVTEINITSPTGISRINHLESISLEDQIWAEIESLL